MHMERHKFTILELLVVISIIMILSSLLLPALGRAKAVAKMAHCTSNLKQIGILMEQYIGENNSCYPLSYDGTDLYQFWGAKLAACGGLRSLDVFICPSVSRENICPELIKTSSTIEQKLTITATAYVSYGINHYGISPNRTEVDGIYKVCKAGKLPANMLIAVDSETDAQPNDGWYSIWHQNFFSGGAAVSSFLLMSRHNRRFNALFTDGHVSSVGVKDLQVTPADSIYSPWYYGKYCKD